MANLQNTVTGHSFTVFRWSISAYYVRYILESWLWNFYSIKLRLIWWTICKILSHAFESSFCTTLIVLIIRTTLWSSYREIVTYTHYDAKDDQFAKFCHTAINHRLHLVIWCLSCERHFGAISVKFSQNCITAWKMTKLQKTIRRLKIIILSLFFLLIITTSIWRPYGKNLANPRFAQKDFQFPRYCHTPLNLRIHLVFLCLSSNRYFGTLTLKFILNPITKDMMINLQNTVKRLGIIVFRKCFAADHHTDILEFFLWNLRRTPLCPQYGQFAKHSHRPLIRPFPLVYFSVLCTEHFGVLTLKCLLN